MKHRVADGFALLQVTRSSFIMYIKVKHEYFAFTDDVQYTVSSSGEKKFTRVQLVTRM